MPGCRCLHILFLLFLFLGMLVQPLYSGETELEKATRLAKQVTQLYQQGRYAEAVPVAEEALAIREKVLGKEHPDVATSLNSLAKLYYEIGRYDEAQDLYKRALAITPCVRVVVTSDRPSRRWGFPIGGGQISLREIHFGGGGG